MYDVGLADRIRARGVQVVEIGGWQTRGNSDFSPYGTVNHHTAGSATGVVPSLNICIYGRTGLPGPLCHVLLGRDLRAYVIAAGRANHAGSGGWMGLTGNSRMHGLEIEHTGYGTSPQQIQVAIQIHAAFLQYAKSSHDARYACQHFEWAPTRKIDFRDLSPWSPTSFRNDIAAALSAVPPSDDEDDEMITVIGVSGDASRLWAGLCDGYVRVFADNEVPVADARTVWCPSEEYHRGVGLFYKSVRMVDPRTYDVMLATAKYRIPAETVSTSKLDARTNVRRIVWGDKDATGKVFITDGITKRKIDGWSNVNITWYSDFAEYNRTTNEPFLVDQVWLDQIPEVV